LVFSNPHQIGDIFGPNPNGELKSDQSTIMYSLLGQISDKKLLIDSPMLKKRAAGDYAEDDLHHIATLVIPSDSDD
jgi:hypothetical protein